MSGMGPGSDTALSPPFFPRCNDVQACKINYAGLIRKHNWLEKGAFPISMPTRFPDRAPHGKMEPRRPPERNKNGRRSERVVARTEQRLRVAAAADKWGGEGVDMPRWKSL